MAAAVPAGAGRIQRIMLAADDSPGSARALEQLLTLRANLRVPEDLELHVINVQRPVAGDVASFVTSTNLSGYHREKADKALRAAREALKAAGLAFREHLHVGDPGPVISNVAASEGCDMIVMGSRGLGSHTAGLVGSVAASTLEHSRVPVLLVRA